MAPITTEGSSIAGLSGYTLICSASKNQFLSDSSTLAVQWLDVNGAIISEDNANFTVSDVGPTSNTVLISRLTFNSLFTSQAGVYTCRTLLTIPGTVDNHSIEETFLVSVKCEFQNTQLLQYVGRLCMCARTLLPLPPICHYWEWPNCSVIMWLYYYTPYLYKLATFPL